MNNITFDNIYNPSYMIAETDLYIHFHYPEMLLRYDSNFIEYKTIPSVDEFKKTEKFLREFHAEKGQKHVKFSFPDNTQLTDELVTYLKDSSFDVGFMELYVIEPSRFPEMENCESLKIKEVSPEIFDEFLSLQYKQDLEFGEAFAEQKIDMHKRNFEAANKMQIIAYYDGKPAGSSDVIITDKTAEIDGLNVLQQFQKKGIGSRLQKYVMDSFHEKTVILVADGEDTPKEMYKRQGYQKFGFKYEVQKVFN
ncbi:GNAT family N-acetyltransferase [Virgibacillus flavescens]|uniref:GNAT family N-acetyltransferase n=1 Tax=Virgibacillus flavescens TaxID=1611422 RepID=UPI003D33D62B